MLDGSEVVVRGLVVGGMNSFVVGDGDDDDDEEWNEESDGTKGNNND